MTRESYGLGAALLLAAITMLGIPTEVSACACCAETGRRFESTREMGDFERAELGTMDFEAAAFLYASAAFPDDVEGVAAPSQKPYRLRSSRDNGQIVLNLVDAAGKGGQIMFPLPRRVTRFEVDPRDDKSKDKGLGAGLYKEWRLEGEVRLSGIFATGPRRATARLILHGYGNSCTSAADFKQWTLSVSGRGVRFTFLGTLNT